MSSRECYINSLQKSEPHTLNNIIIDIVNEASVDVEMADVPEQRHASE